jgi:sRNA-binding regulator protein Hfq
MANFFDYGNYNNLMNAKNGKIDNMQVTQVTLVSIQLTNGFHVETKASRFSRFFFFLSFFMQLI